MEYQDYVDYVQEQIKQFKKYTDLIDENLNEITPAQINYNLAHYTNVNLGLNAEYQRKKNQLNKLKRDFQVWWDEQFVEVRREVNPSTLPGSKWLSKQEIESETRARHKSEYLQWRDEVDALEDSVAFLNRLLNQWAEHGRMLTTLSQNMRQEMVSLGLQERVNKTDPHRRPTFDEGKTKTRRRKTTNITEAEEVQ